MQKSDTGLNETSPRAVPINIIGEILLRYGTLKEMSARIVMSIAATFAFANTAFAQSWNGLAAISNTLELYADRLCVGADPSLTLGCPTYAPNLDASGNISTTGHISATAYYGDGSALTGISANTDRIVSGTTNIIANTTGSISFTTAGTTAMVISGSNVGIGTTAPEETLNVQGTAAGSEKIVLKLSNNSGNTNSAVAMTFENANGTGTHAKISAARTDAAIGGDTDLIFSSYGSSSLRERMRLKSDGNVGIGTTAPSEKLVVYGNAIFSQGINVGDAVNAPVSGGMRIARAGTSEPFVLFENADGASALSQVRGINGGGIRFTNGSSVVSWMDITNAGNVGIGTTSPAKTLHVSGTTHITSTTTVSGTIHATEIKVSNAEQPCNAASVGTLRWNAAKRRPEMCFPDAP